MKYLWLFTISWFLVALQLVMLPFVDIPLIGLVLAIFFLDKNTCIAYALISGVLRGLFFPLFGFHFFIYGIEGLLGIVLIHTIITHRSFLGFTGVVWCILLAHFLLTQSILFFLGMAISELEFLTPSLTDGIESLFSSVLVYGTASIAYCIIGRMQYAKRYGMIIERV